MSRDVGRRISFLTVAVICFPPFEGSTRSLATEHPPDVSFPYGPGDVGPEGQQPDIRPMTGRPSLLPASHPSLHQHALRLACLRTSGGVGLGLPRSTPLPIVGDLGPSSTPVVCGPRGATLENPIPPLAFWPKPISLFGLPRCDDAYRRLPGLTISPDPSPHPALRLPGRDPSHDFLLSPRSWRFGTLSEGLRTAMDAPWKHALVGYPRRNAGSGHCYCSVPNNRARQAITRHRVASNGRPNRLAAVLGSGTARC